MNEQENEDRVKAIIAEQLGKEPDAIRADHRLREDPDADSLDETEIAMTIEEAIELEIDDTEVAEIKTAGQAIALAKSKVVAKIESCA
jgi:acyl carrier protein